MAKAKKTKSVKEKKPEFYQAVGRRKVSTARVRLYVAPSTGVPIKDKIITAVK